MTTGTITSGIEIPVSTSQGISYAKYNLATKTWSGTDYPPGSRQRNLPPQHFELVKTRVNENGEWKVIEYRRPLRIPQRGAKWTTEEEHPYTMALSVWNDRQFEYSNDGGSSYRWATCGQLAGYQNFDFQWSSNDELELVGKLRTAIAGSDFNLGVSLGESREALSMIANSATRIAGAWKQAKRGDFRRAANLLTAGTPRSTSHRSKVAGNWLELQYGWLPLLSDAENGAKFLAHHYNVPRRKIYRVTKVRKGTISGGNASAAYAVGNCYIQRSIKAIITEVNVPQLAGLTDPLSVAWELTPYSFVADWFLPIGDFLSARGLSQSLAGRFVYSEKSHGYVGGISFPGWIVRTGRPEECSKLEVSAARWITESLQVPFPSVVPLSEALSWKRAANAVALLSQVVK